MVVPPDADSGVSAYDATLRDLSQCHNGMIAQAAANGVFFSANSRDFADAAWPAPQIVTFLTLSLCGAALAFGLRRERGPTSPASRTVPRDLVAAR